MEEKQRKIMIMTDIHGLYEPTLVLLEKAKEEKITEIYSLGDNIGLGPNPNEVLNLLEEYNVKSVLGNHELYLLEGVEKYLKHFIKTDIKAYIPQKEDTKWLKNNLNLEQINKISKFPRAIELEIGNKKILLCHSVYDYNNEKEIYDMNKYDEVFQGHIHFEFEFKKIRGIRAVAMGHKNNELGTASCCIITENIDKKGYKIETRLINYNMEKTCQKIKTINPPQAKKVDCWIKYSK